MRKKTEGMTARMRGPRPAGRAVLAERARAALAADTEARLSDPAVLLRRYRENLKAIGVHDFMDAGVIPPRALREEMVKAAALVTLGVLVDVQLDPEAAASDRIAAGRVLLQAGLGFANANVTVDGQDAAPSVVVVPAVVPPAPPPADVVAWEDAGPDAPKALPPDPDALDRARALVRRERPDWGTDGMLNPDLPPLRGGGTPP